MSEEKKSQDVGSVDKSPNVDSRSEGIMGEITAEGTVSKEAAEEILGFKLDGIEKAVEPAQGEQGSTGNESSTETPADADVKDDSGNTAKTGENEADAKSENEQASAKDDKKSKAKTAEKTEKGPGFFERMEMREPKQKEVRKKSKDDKRTFGEYVGEIVEETKKVTWPTKPEILKWSLVVLAALAFFMVFTFLVDTFIANPLIYGISGFSSGEGFGRKAIILSVLFVLTGLGSAAGVMLHAGGDQNGLSDGLSATLTGGSAVAEKNLDRLTIVMIALFTLTAIAMMIWFPLGTMGN